MVNETTNVGVRQRGAWLVVATLLGDGGRIAVGLGTVAPAGSSGGRFARSSHFPSENVLTRLRRWFTIITPMARTLTADTLLQGQALSSFGAYACQPGIDLDHEAKPGRRESANAGRPVVRW